MRLTTYNICACKHEKKAIIHNDRFWIVFFFVFLIYNLHIHKNSYIRADPQKIRDSNSLSIESNQLTDDVVEMLGTVAR